MFRKSICICICFTNKNAVAHYVVLFHPPLVVQLSYFNTFSSKHDEPVLPSALTFSTESLDYTQIRSSLVYLKYLDNSDIFHVKRSTYQKLFLNVGN